MLLEKLSARFKYSCFLNIVEEPELNLYPISQKEILFELLRSTNDVADNKLIITTHSPYLINYLTLVIKADQVKAKIHRNENSQQMLKELSDIVPLKSTIPPETVSIYQINETGDIHRLSDYNGLPSDDNLLNQFLSGSNDLFIQLMEIEEKCR